MPIDIRDCKNGHSILYLKTPKNAHDFFMDLDEHVIDTTKSHVTEWFGNRVRSTMINEFFTPSMFLNKSHGKMIKLHLITNELCDAIANTDSSSLELSLVLHGLCFKPKSFNMLWHVLRVAPSKAVQVEFHDDDDHYVSSDDENEVVPTPTDEDVQQIRNSLVEQIDLLSTRAAEQFSTWQQRADDCATLRKNLDSANSLRSFVDLHEKLQALGDIM